MLDTKICPTQVCSISLKFFHVFEGSLEDHIRYPYPDTIGKPTKTAQAALKR